MPPGTLCSIAKTGKVPKKWYRKLGIPLEIPTPPCPTCGAACTFDCGTQRITAKPGTGRRRAPRVEIALNDPIKARARLEEKLREYHGVDLL
jgi:hypothetical protein